MAIAATERLENAVSAIYNYLESNYTLTTKYFSGSNTLDTSSLTEWVEFEIEEVPMRRFLRQVTEATLGDLAAIYVLATAYVKPSNNIMRIFRIRDSVMNLLRRAMIQILDRAGLTGNLGRLRCQGLVEDNHLGIEKDVDR